MSSDQVFARQCYAGDPPPSDPPNDHCIWNPSFYVVRGTWVETDGHFRKRIKRSTASHDLPDDARLFESALASLVEMRATLIGLHDIIKPMDVHWATDTAEKIIADICKRLQ